MIATPLQLVLSKRKVKMSELFVLRVMLLRLKLRILYGHNTCIVIRVLTNCMKGKINFFFFLQLFLALTTFTTFTIYKLDLLLYTDIFRKEMELW